MVFLVSIVFLLQVGLVAFSNSPQSSESKELCYYIYIHKHRCTYTVHVHTHIYIHIYTDAYMYYMYTIYTYIYKYIYNTCMYIMYEHLA